VATSGPFLRLKDSRNKILVSEIFFLALKQNVTSVKRPVFLSVIVLRDIPNLPQGSVMVEGIIKETVDTIWGFNFNEIINRTCLA
jgi:hypothetical protein